MSEDDILGEASRWRDAGRGVALATVVTTWGSSPRPVGSQLAVDDKGKTPLPAAIESALRELGCGHISPEVTPYIHGNMNL